MKTRSCWLLWLGLLFCGAAQAALPPPPAERLAALQRGVNLPIWFTYRDAPGIDPALWHPDAADWQQIRALGFRHVRVQFDPVYFRGSSRPGRVQAARMAELRRALAPAWSSGLVVVLAAEPLGEEKSRLVRDEQGRAELAAFWRAFAKSLRGVSPEQLLFELLNEPTDTDAAGNRALMQQLAEAVRAVAPRHTLVVEGHGYSGVDELIAFEPLPLANLVYSFHFYEPTSFTHQGATWSWPLFAQFKDWPYPSTPEEVAPRLAAATEEARPHLAWYGEQRWDAAKLASRLDQVRDWSAQHGLPVWCGEFGAARLGAPEADRQRWLRDVRTGLEARGIPWTLFDYAGHFGLVAGTAGARQLQAGDVEALGLVGASQPPAP